MRLSRVISPAAVLSIFGGLSSAADTPGPSALDRDPDPKTGMAVFRSKGCAQCHAVLGDGGTIGPELTRTASAGDPLELAAAMWSHGPRMWQHMSRQQIPVPKFQEEEMEDLFAFLGMAASLDEAGNTQAGERLFQSKRCATCHSIHGQGGKLGPDLANTASSQNPIGWVAAMWNHAPGMLAMMTRQGIPFPRFEGGEMADLRSYITSLAVSQAAKPVYHPYFRPPSAKEGEVLFRKKQCSRCHGTGGREARVAPDLTSAPLPRKYGAIAIAMWNHAPQMQRTTASLSIPYPRVEVQELPDLLAYLSRLSLMRRGDPVAGANTFRTRGCSNCHAVAAGAAAIGPNLSGLPASLTPLTMAHVMWNHGPAMFQKMGGLRIAWPVFTSKELADTVAFLRTLQNGR